MFFGVFRGQQKGALGLFLDQYEFRKNLKNAIAMANDIDASAPPHDAPASSAIDLMAPEHGKITQHDATMTALAKESASLASANKCTLCSSGGRTKKEFQEGEKSNNASAGHPHTTLGQD